MKKTGKIIWSIFIVLLAFILTLWIFFTINSSGKLPPLVNGATIPNAIVEKEWVDIGGIRQGFFLRGENRDHPVMLYLHGGPGSPELPLILPMELGERPEKYLTVCYWDQRGAGMTYHSETPIETMTVKQMVEDTREMTEYLMKRFNKEKIYLAGHSWGSYLGIKTIETYPELYAAYIGIGQVTDQTQSEKLAYDYMLQHAEKIGDKDAMKKLKKFDKNAADFPSIAYLIEVRTPLMNRYGIGIKHENTSIAKIALEVLLFPGYTITEKWNYIQGMSFSLNNVFNSVLEDNLFTSSTSFEIPVYIVQGKYDYQVSHQLAKEYLERIRAPIKEFYSFENSAHSPNMEESSKFVMILKEIVEKTESTKEQQKKEQ